MSERALTGFKADIAEFPELADVVPFSADWYRRWRDLRLAKYPDVDQGTRDNLDLFVEQAEKREARDADYARLREGLCPVHGSALDRRDDHGWCDECGMGWSMTPGTLTTHFDFAGIMLDGRQMGPARARFTRDAPA